MPTVVCADATLYYEVHGSGPPVVFAHGAGGNTLIWWQQVAHFAKHYTVLTFDHRGFGRSTCAPDGFHPKCFVDDLRAILDAAKLDRAALVCQSMGGWTGFPAAIRMPERVACLVLSGTPGGLVTDATAAYSANAIAQRVAHASTPEELTLSLVCAPDFPKREPARALLYTQISGLNDPATRANLSTLFDAEACVAAASLNGYNVPTLVVFGEHDAFFGPAALHEVADQIPGATAHEFPGVGHSPYWEVPEQFNALVGDFLARHLGA